MQKSHSPRKRAPKQRRAIVLATPEGEIQFADRMARRWLKQFFGRSDSSRLLPRKICRWLKAHDQQRTATSTVARLHNAALFVARHRFSTEHTTLLVLELITAKGDQRLRCHRNLTRRENEVLRWVVRGKSNPEIAAILGTKSATVKKHLERIYPKLGVENRAAAISLDLDSTRQGATCAS